ncbi:MAG TPA: N-formylglutamate amidohydrolase [Gammaproteobacteria bacterium]|nr:N-formylglutamate amidohydrolase [Gammaproteobacteria bacterium]
MTPARILRPQGRSRFVLLCDHASNHIPAELGNLGLPESELIRHIAWDIGAAGVTEALSERLDAPAILCGTSRLVIDCNRQLDNPALIPIVSDGTPVPGNAGLSDASRRLRIERWFQPYHDAIEAVLLERIASGVESIVIAIHSMAPALDGRKRPWQIAVSSHEDRRLSDPLLTALRAPGDLVVGDNEPYCIEPAIDFSIPFHAIRRGLPHLQVEFRQDEIADTAAARRWASRFAEALISAVRRLRFGS